MNDVWMFRGDGDGVPRRRDRDCAATGILFLKGRLTFIRGDGISAKANAGAPSCLIAYSEADALALRVSGLAGVYVPLATSERVA